MPIRIPIQAKLVCPHCHVAFLSEWESIGLGADADGRWDLCHTTCPKCDRMIVMLRQFDLPQSGGENRSIPLPTKLKQERMVHPRVVARAPIPEKVPKSIARDYDAACRVLPESADASAALSRRCLQNLLVEEGTVTKQNLNQQIQEVLDAGSLPKQLAEDLDVVRVVGNFAAHPLKSESTGEIVDVETGEAEWTLDVLEALFDFLFVQSEKRSERRAALNAKLKDAGKNPLR